MSCTYILYIISGRDRINQKAGLCAALKVNAPCFYAFAIQLLLLLYLSLSTKNIIMENNKGRRKIGNNGLCWIDHRYVRV